MNLSESSNFSRWNICISINVHHVQEPDSRYLYIIIDQPMIDPSGPGSEEKTVQPLFHPLLLTFFDYVLWRLFE